MSVEAAIFALGAFEPIHPDAPRPDWAKIYPQLGDPNYVNKEKFVSIGQGQSAPQQDTAVAAKIAALEASLANSITPDRVQNFGKGMQDLSDGVAKMKDFTEASIATTEYAKNVKAASSAITEMNKSYAATVGAMSEMANASKDTKAYHAQVQTLTKNLTELNAVYEVELRSAGKHVKAMNDFYSNIGVAMQNVANASKDTEKFKTEMSTLTTNLTSLNSVYGAMLTAMRGGNK
jgi:gliding motility-associated protein GldL